MLLMNCSPTASAFRLFHMAAHTKPAPFEVPSLHMPRSAPVRLPLFLSAPRLYPQFLMLSHHHHCDVLRISEVKFVKIRFICFYDLLRAGVKRKTDLVLQFEGIVSILHNAPACAMIFLAKSRAALQPPAFGLSLCNMAKEPLR